MQSHICEVYACLAVICHLHFGRRTWIFLRAAVVTCGWNGYRNNSQHRKSTLEKKCSHCSCIFCVKRGRGRGDMKPPAQRTARRRNSEITTTGCDWPDRRPTRWCRKCCCPCRRSSATGNLAWNSPPTRLPANTASSYCPMSAKTTPLHFQSLACFEAFVFAWLWFQFGFSFCFNQAIWIKKNMMHWVKITGNSLVPIPPSLTCSPTPPPKQWCLLTTVPTGKGGGGTEDAVIKVTCAPLFSLEYPVFTCFQIPLNWSF